MRYFRLLTPLFLVLLLPGCASINNLFSSQTTAEAQLEEQVIAIDDQSDGLGTDAAVLDPMQLKVQELRSQPNLYLSGSVPVVASVKYQFDQGFAAKQDGKFELAEQLFQKLSTEHAQLSGPWVQLGDIKMQRFSQLDAEQEEDRQQLLLAAKSDYEKAIRLNQHNYFAQNRLAKVYREMGEFTQAEQHYQYAISSYPAFDNGYLNLGILYDLYLGEKQLALTNYELYQALQDKPKRQVRGWIADLERQIAKMELTDEN